MNFHLLVRTTLLFILIGALWPTPALPAQTSVSMTVTPAFAGNYVPGTWLPITAFIENSGTAQNVLLVATLPGAPIRQVVPVELPGGAQKQVTLYLAMDQSVREVVVTVEQDGATLTEQTLAVRPRTNERMLGLLSSTELSLGLPRRENMSSQPFTALSLAPSDMPDRPAGLSSLDLVLLHNLSPESLSETQLSALVAWINAGGHLLIGGGAAADTVSDWLPEQLLAATIGAETMIDDDPLSDLADEPGPGSLSGLQLTPLPGGISTGAAPNPAWVSKSFGQGMVTQLAFDPTAPAIEGWEGAPQFWNAFLQPTFRVSSLFGEQTNVDMIQEQALTSTLTALPTIDQPPVDWFFLVLVIYTIVIGPGLALLLHQIDRQSWSWLLVPVIAVSSGLLLFTLALSLRASDKVVSQISLIEELGNGQARGRTLIAALAPQGEIFTTQVSPDVISRPLRPINGLYGEIIGVRGDLTQQSDQIELEIEPWQLQGIFLEQQLPLSGIAATINIDDQGAQIEVNNGSNQTLRDVVAIYGGRVLILGNIRSNEQVSRFWAPNQSLALNNTSIIGQIFADDIAAANRPGQAARRINESQIAMVNAALSRGDTTLVTGPLLLAWIDQSPLEAVVDLPRAAQQSLTLLTTRPQVQTSGPLSLPIGWLNIDPSLSQNSSCSSNGQTGIRTNAVPVTIMLRLPDDLSQFSASSLTLTLDSSERWPNAGVTTEIYDWEQGIWVDQSFDGPGELELSDPAAYLFEGRLQIRFSGSIQSAGCITATATIQGEIQ
jgi:hypothetical protein